jgi:hypothetical protein
MVTNLSPLGKLFVHPVTTALKAATLKKDSLTGRKR